MYASNSITPGRCNTRCGYDWRRHLRPNGLMRTMAIPATFVTALSGMPAVAQVSVSGTTRLRVETIDGQARAGFNQSDTLLNLRTTVKGQYEDGPIKVVGELWDSRVYGDNERTPLSTGDVNALELVQAYVEWKRSAPIGRGSTATIQAGRFLLNLGSRRLVAADDYRNTTNGYTGVRADLAFTGGWKSTAIYVLPQQLAPSRAEPGNLLYDLWRDQTQLGRFVLDKLYRDADAVAAHRATPHFQAYLAEIESLADRVAFVLDPASAAGGATMRKMRKMRKMKHRIGIVPCPTQVFRRCLKGRIHPENMALQVARSADAAAKPRPHLGGMFRRNSHD